MSTSQSTLCLSLPINLILEVSAWQFTNITPTCQVTPDGQLANMLRKKVGTTKTGGKRLVQEEGGNPISLGLKSRDPFAVNTCRYGDNQCLGRPGQDCGAMGAI